MKTDFNLSSHYYNVTYKGAVPLISVVKTIAQNVLPQVRNILCECFPRNNKWSVEMRYFSTKTLVQFFFILFY